MKIIFLDIDGPMIPTTMLMIHGASASQKRKFSPISVGLINSLCSLDDKIKIVFNSAHNDDGVMLYNDSIREGIRSEYIHQNFITTYPSTNYNRIGAIEHWLRKHGMEATNWCCFDDYDLNQTNHILVEFDLGIQISHYTKAKELLGISMNGFLL